MANNINIQNYKYIITNPLPYYPRLDLRAMDIIQVYTFGEKNEPTLLEAVTKHSLPKERSKETFPEAALDLPFHPTESPHGPSQGTLFKDLGSSLEPLLVCSCGHTIHFATKSHLISQIIICYHLVFFSSNKVTDIRYSPKDALVCIV